MAFICFVMVLVVAVNIFSFITMRIELDKIADELIEAASYSGCFGEDYEAALAVMQDDYFDFDAAESAEKYFNATYKRVQLGNRMSVTVSKQVDIAGLGMLKIPVTVSVKKSGLSERYWK